jgi:DNA-binding LacI/PurR family transcriptional regulator
VLDCIREQEYEVGMISKALVGELSYMIAVLASNLGSPFHMMIFRGVGEVLESRGYHTLVHNVRPEDQPDPKTLASLHAYRPAGYIILRGAEGLKGLHAREIVEAGIPLVTQGQVEGLETHSVNFDNRAAMKTAADYVIEQGHRRIGHIAGPTFSKGAQQRKMGIIESLVEHGISISDATIVDGGETAVSGYQMALKMLKDPESRPTALLCFNDMVAVGVYRAAHELGLGIPEDLSVVGFDGVDFAEFLGPPLTTVDICPVELGRRAAELLLSAIKNPVKRGFETQWIETKLIERGSVRRIESSAPPVRKDEVENLDRAPLREQIASSSVYPSN